VDYDVWFYLLENREDGGERRYVAIEVSNIVRLGAPVAAGVKVEDGDLGRGRRGGSDEQGHDVVAKEAAAADYEDLAQGFLG
jgi:hypothetical protein